MNMSVPSPTPGGQPGNMSNCLPPPTSNCSINANELLTEYSEEQEIQNQRCQQPFLQHGPYFDPQYRTPPPPSFDEQVIGKWHSTGHVPDPLIGTPLPQTTRIYRGSLGDNIIH